MHIGPAADNFWQVLLHIASQPSPVRTAAAESRQKLKRAMLCGQALEVLAIVNVFFSAHPEQQRELMSLMPGKIFQQPVQNRSKGSDAGSRGDEHRVPQRRTEDEAAEGTLKSDFLALCHVAEVVRHEAVLDTIQAECETTVVRRRRRDRICACDFLAVCFRGRKR